MGTVKLSSSDRSASLRIGFVPQQDILPPTLTVFEALLFASRLRLPEGILYAQKVKRVEEIMEKLGISHLRNVRIGYSGHDGGSRSRGISGGEMRRVSIGLELISDPDILILDEPTSGKFEQATLYARSDMSLPRIGFCVCISSCKCASQHRS